VTKTRSSGAYVQLNCSQCYYSLKELVILSSICKDNSASYNVSSVVSLTRQHKAGFTLTRVRVRVCLQGLARVALHCKQCYVT